MAADAGGELAKLRAKLAALAALNSALQKENEQLRDELDEASAPKTEAGAHRQSRGLFCMARQQLVWQLWRTANPAAACCCCCCPATDLEALELKEEFARRLGEQQRTIDILKARCWANGSSDRASALA